MRKTNNDQLRIFIENSLKEDICDGDHSSLSCIPEAAPGKVKLLVKDQGIIAGISVASEIFHHIDPNLTFTRNLQDGDFINPGNIAFYLQI